MKYEIDAIYKVRKILEVEIKEGDANDPANWVEILSEHDKNCYLYEVLDAHPTTSENSNHE